MPELAGLLLAAGGSRRLGSPKQLLEIDGQPLVARQADLLLGVCDSAAVVIGAAADEVEHALRDRDVTLARNGQWRSGMASSLRAGVRALARSADAVLILLCDQYRLQASDLQRLRRSWEQSPHAIVAAKWSGLLGAPAIFPRPWFAALQSLGGDRGARRLLTQSAEHVIDLVLPNARFDLDTEEDLAVLRNAGRQGGEKR